MPRYGRDELEQAFHSYWRTGAVGEDWDAWADLFTEDCRYFEHFYGHMRGRETVRAWIKPVMERYGEIYTAYEWHVVDPEGGRVVFYMQNRRDHPGGRGTIDFPGVSILEYAGGGKWNDVAHAAKLHFQGLDMQVVNCGNVPGHPPGSTSPWTR